MTLWFHFKFSIFLYLQKFSAFIPSITKWHFLIFFSTSSKQLNLLMQKFNQLLCKNYQYKCNGFWIIRIGFSVLNSHFLHFLPVSLKLWIAIDCFFNNSNCLNGNSKNVDKSCFIHTYIYTTHINIYTHAFGMPKYSKIHMQKISF